MKNREPFKKYNRLASPCGTKRSIKIIGFFGFAIFWAALLLIGEKSYASRQLILKVVGAIEEKVITTRDVEASYLVDRALYNDGPIASISAGTEEFGTALNRLLIEWMVRDEANTFGVAKVADTEIDESFSTVKQRLVSSAKARWQALEISDSKLKDIIGRKMRANRFIKYKSNSVTSRSATMKRVTILIKTG